jgi:putative addiction module component (TIGR02574 family)
MHLWLCWDLALLRSRSYAIGVNADLLEAAKALPLPERIELAEALWEDITKAGYEPPLTPAQAAEIDRRIEEHRKNPASAIPWEQVKAELEQKYRGSK